jgi:murein L,D-transpeptidase YafK
LKHKIENSGDITVEQAREFYKDLDSSGGISKFVNEDEVISLDEKSVTTMKDRALDYKNDVRYDNEAVTHVDTTVKETDFSKFNEDKRTDLDEFLELHKTTEDSNIKNALTEVDEDIANESFLDAYRSCRGFK